MGFNIGKTIKKAVKSVTKDPIGTLTLGGLTTNALLKGLGGRSVNLTQAGLYGAAGFLMGGPLGGAAGLAYGVAAQGGLGTGIQDIATMGASAQMRYQQKMTAAYNAAQREQARIAEEQNRQNILQQVRAARIARAMNLTDYAGESGVFSSGAAGNLGSIGSQYLSNLGFSVRTGQAANAYQTYMNQYNWYQTQARNSQIRWQNRMNLFGTALSIYGQGQSLQTAGLSNFYARLRNADAWADASAVEEEAAKIPSSWTGNYLSFNG